MSHLVRSGLVARTRAPPDGRRVEITLTAAGRAVLGRAPAAAQDRLIAALGLLGTATRKDLARHLGKLGRGDGRSRFTIPRCSSRLRRPRKGDPVPTPPDRSAKSHRQAARIGDFTTGPRTISISALALVVGVLAAYVAKGLLALITFFTNLFFFQRLSLAPVTPQHLWLFGGPPSNSEPASRVRRRATVQGLRPKCPLRRTLSAFLCSP